MKKIKENIGICLVISCILVVAAVATAVKIITVDIYDYPTLFNMTVVLNKSELN